MWVDRGTAVRIPVDKPVDYRRFRNPRFVDIGVERYCCIAAICQNMSIATSGLAISSCLTPAEARRARPLVPMVPSPWEHPSPLADRRSNEPPQNLCWMLRPHPQTGSRRFNPVDEAVNPPVERLWTGLCKTLWKRHRPWRFSCAGRVYNPVANRLRNTA
jgi:hypothetical protein